GQVEECASDVESPSLIMLLVIPGGIISPLLMDWVCERVCSPQTVCALRDSVVNLMCSYSGTVKPTAKSSGSAKNRALTWRNEDDPEDLALDSDYAGRVSSNHTGFSSTLTITDLRETDSGDYHLMIITGGGERRRGSAVNLTVSDLQVTMSRVTQTALRTTCSTSCSVTPENFYLWYKNGQREKARSNRQIDLFSSSVPYSVSCSAATHFTHFSEVLSSSVCVFGEDCWNVSYSDRRLCVLEGSLVDFLCTYSHPSTHTVTEVFWYYSDPNGKLKDLRVEERFAGRVQFLGGKEGNCSLRMRDVRKSDSGEYRFRFITDTAGGEFSGTPGVVLKVTDLQVRASPSSPPEGQTVTLTCTSTCTLPNNPTYIWYKSGEPVTNIATKSNKLYLESASSEELHQYSCALGDRGLTPEGKGDGAVLKPIMAAVGVCLALILVPVSVWIWRRKSSSAKDPRSTEDSGQCDEALDTQEDLHYSTVHFRPSHSADESPSTTSTLPLDVTDVQYADVKFSRRGAAT
ncbi:hypothetical protein NFI96_031428, partial [Prochilodus magdalenae]